MDIRGIFTGGIKEKGKDNSPKKKRPAEEGVSLTPPPPRQKFQQSWKSNFPWVVHQDGAMFCTWCEEKKNLSDSSSAFFSSGCYNFHLESLRSHAGSAGHKRAQDCIRVAVNPQEAAIPRALRH